MNSLTPTGWRKISLKSQHFTYHFGDGKDPALDGPTMLLVLLKAANPSTRVGLSSLKRKLSRASVTTYDDDFTKLIDAMEVNYQDSFWTIKIVEWAWHHGSFTNRQHPISATIIETYLAKIATSFFESLATVDISGHWLRLRFIIDLLCDMDMGTKAVQIDAIDNKEQQ